MPVGHGAGQPVEQLHRRAEGHIGVLDSPFEGLVVRAVQHDQVQPQFAQKGRKEREQSLQHELIGQGDGLRPRVGT